MSIRVRWHNDDEQLLVVQFTAHWTWSAFFRAKAVLDNLLDNVDTPINCLFLLPSDIILPPDSIRNGQHAFETRHHNLNQIVIVKPNMLIRTIYDMVYRKNPEVSNYIVFVETNELALHYLDKQSAR